MYESIVNWESCSAQLALMNALKDEGLLQVMPTEFFGAGSRCLYGAARSEVVAKEKPTCQMVKSALLRN